MAAFLEPALAALEDPFLLRNLDAAVARVRQAIAANENVVVLGDYDVDGVSSTALLVSVLRRFGLQPRFVVPRRFEDGYGLSRSAIDRALAVRSPPRRYSKPARDAANRAKLRKCTTAISQYADGIASRRSPIRNG